MALAFQATVTGSGTTSPTTSGAFGVTLGASQLLVVTTADDSGLSLNGVTGVTCSDGTVLTNIPTASGAGSVSMNMWYGVIVAGGASKTIAVSWNVVNTGRVTFAAQSFNGFTGVPTLDQVSTTGSTGTAVSSNATPATTVAAELVVGGAAHASTISAFTLGTGYTNLGTQNVANAASAQESKVVAATGAQTATFTIAASRDWECGVATFYDLVGGGAAVSSVGMPMMGIG